MTDFLADVSNRLAELEAELKLANFHHYQQLLLLRGELDQFRHKLTVLTNSYQASLSPLARTLARIKHDAHRQANSLERQSSNSQESINQ